MTCALPGTPVTPEALPGATAWYAKALAIPATLLPHNTTTSTVPTACAGATAVTWVGDTATTFVAGTPPKLTPVTAPRFAPVMLTAVPPVTGPAGGATVDTAMSVGAETNT